MSNISGLTLIELLISLVLMTILLFAFVPSNGTVYQQVQMQRMEREIKNAVHFAKLQALTQRQTLVLRSLSEQGDWSRGAALYMGTTLLRQWQWQLAGFQVTWRGFQSDNCLLFTPDVRYNAINGYFFIQNTYGSRKLMVNRLGRIRVSGKQYDD